MGNPKDEPDLSPAGTKDRKERLSEATSEKTLSDLEDTEKASGSAASQTDSSPAPDGEFAKSDDRDDAGPM